MTQFRYYCDASYDARSRESDPIYDPIVPRSFANEWVSAARDTLESPVICLERDNLVDFFFSRSLIVNQPCERAWLTALSSQCNYAGRSAAQDSGKISREDAPAIPYVNETFTSSSFQRPTFRPRISTPLDFTF